MRLTISILVLVLAITSSLQTAVAVEPASAQGSLQPNVPVADFVFIGSYHLDNPGRDVGNVTVDDVLGEERQRQIAEVVEQLKRFKPTKVMVEVDAQRQASLDADYRRSCEGARPLQRSEVEQLGFRLACDLKLPRVNAVDWSGMGPIKDEQSIDYVKAVERHHQQRQYKEMLDYIRIQTNEDERVLRQGSILEALLHINDDSWLKFNAGSYYLLARLGTEAEPVGANWVQSWFGRNLAIFNNIVSHTENGDRIMVIYGAGHGNHLRQLAADSGIYRMQTPASVLHPGRPAR